MLIRRLLVLKHLLEAHFTKSLPSDRKMLSHMSGHWFDFLKTGDFSAHRDSVSQSYSRKSKLTLFSGNDRKYLDQVSRAAATARSSGLFHELPTFDRARPYDRRLGHFGKRTVIGVGKRS